MRKIKLPVEYYPCKCLKPQEYRDQGNTCIKFHPETGAFDILYNDISGEIWSRIMFCPFCGGRSPQGKYKPPITRPLSQKEKLQETTLKQKIKSLEDAYGLLGEPDRIFTQYKFKNPSQNAVLLACEVIDNTQENEEHFTVFIHPKKT
ncbi:MAG: hypothetical protein H6858_07780 [Rhodospirillales bacterium]|nr:hypothetical protein [Alphaproteobacteria bacterium]MCB9977480.1 hypothetical protein [Rhodospirillales bacterium]